MSDREFPEKRHTFTYLIEENHKHFCVDLAAMLDELQNDKEAVIIDIKFTTRLGPDGVLYMALIIYTVAVIQPQPYDYKRRTNDHPV